MFTKAFFADSIERAVRAFASSLSALLVAGGTGLLDTDWQTDASVSGMAAVVSFLLSIAGGKIGGDTSPASLVSPPKE